MNPIIRLVTPDDSAALREIYAKYIDTTITFELTMPDLTEYARRIEETRAEFPYLVYEQEGRLTGYAYAHRIREREAYQWSAELSIYLAPDFASKGTGARLYECLISLLALQNVRNVYGGITGGNARSIRFHEKLGFNYMGTYRSIGYKNGTWLDVLWYERQIAPWDQPEPFVPFGELDRDLVQRLIDTANKRAFDV